MHIRHLINDKNFIYISKTRIDKEFESFIHTHNNLEILFVNEGEGYINFVKDKIEIKKGNLIIVNKGSKHIEVSNSFLDFFAIGIRNAFILNKFSNDDNLIKINLNNDLIYEFGCLYKFIFKECEELNTYYQNNIENYLNILMNKLLRFSNLTLSISSEKKDYLIDTIKNYIDNNYNQTIKLDSLANSLNLSKSSICHKFKESMNISIIDYKIIKQLEEAKNLLEISDMSVIEICNLVGFNSSSYFSKQFKKRYNISPMEFRKEKTNE